MVDPKVCADPHLFTGLKVVSFSGWKLWSSVASGVAWRDTTGFPFGSRGSFLSGWGMSGSCWFWVGVSVGTPGRQSGEGEGSLRDSLFMWWMAVAALKACCWRVQEHGELVKASRCWSLWLLHLPSTWIWQSSSPSARIRTGRCPGPWPCLQRSWNQDGAFSEGEGLRERGSSSAALTMGVWGPAQWWSASWGSSPSCSWQSLWLLRRHRHCKLQFTLTL